MPPIILMIITIAACLGAGVPAQALASPQQPSKQEMKQLADEMEGNLDNHILRLRWSGDRRDSDARSGFREGFDEAWEPTGSRSQRSIVFQSRMTWVNSEVIRRYGETHGLLARVQRGVEVLQNVMWDKELGGFYWQVDAATGKPTPAEGEKHAYGNAFGIYASAAAYLATKDASALDLAKKAFTWLDDHAHDAKNGGYYEALARDGRPILAAPAPGRRDSIGTEYGQKSMNSHIHLLEAFTELHKAWHDPKLKKRLEEVFKIVRDKVYSAPGYLHMFFKPDWSPASEEDSYGHDIETAYLLVEAAEELGLHEDKATWRAARNLVDHALQVGWDEKHGGFYDHGPALKPATGLEKVWWTQAEGLNALLLMHERYGKSDPKYYAAFRKQWDFIVKHQIDHKYGGWLTSVEADGKAKPGQSKSDMWKDPYHQGRAVMNVIARLRKLAGADGH